jgi:hypothetical protein
MVALIMKYAFALLVSFPCLVFAQGGATIYGTVSDSGGAVMPGVSVTIRHMKTAAVREAVTDSTGGYVAVQLPVGTFEVRVTPTGFKAWLQREIVLRVSDNRRVDVTLQVGDVSERVEVQAAVTQVETRTGTIGEVIDSRRISERFILFLCEAYLRFGRVMIQLRRG